MARARRGRGQAAVETAVCIIVFITVLIMGIHFAEYGFMAIRVQEAAISPLWDATAFRVHRMVNEAAPARVGDFSAFSAIAPTVGADAADRFADFDGRRSRAGGSSVTAAYTRIEGLQAECFREDRVYFDLPRGTGPMLLMGAPGDFGRARPGSGQRGANHSVLGRVYENVGGMACAAGARITGLRVPRSFLEGPSGFFAEAHPRPVQVHLCASGRLVGESCPGQFSLLLGDWGFIGLDEGGHCPLQPDRPNEPCPENRPFYNAARYVFEDNEGWGGREASQLALTFVGADPMPDQGFFMSYRGIEDGYVEPLTPPGEPLDMAYRPYNTGGVSDRPVATRGRCFLGRDGC